MANGVSRRSQISSGGGVGGPERPGGPGVRVGRAGIRFPGFVFCLLIIVDDLSHMLFCDGLEAPILLFGPPTGF